MRKKDNKFLKAMILSGFAFMTLCSFKAQALDLSQNINPKSRVIYSAKIEPRSFGIFTCLTNH